MREGTKNKSLENISEHSSGEENCFLILFNDNVNSYDYVVKSLIEVCNHHPLQAEQCTFIAHHNGKCDVKKGSYALLETMKEELDKRGLTSSIASS